MLRRWRLKNVHGRFLESCRNLADGRDYWRRGSPFARWLLQLLTPVPLLSLSEGGGSLAAALEWLESRCRSTPLSEAVIRGYHLRLEPAAGGAYRTDAAFLVGSGTRPAAPSAIPPLMARWSRRLADAQSRLDAAPDRAEALRLAVDAYQRIGLIHPFPDGNGRVARLAMNHLLRRYGLGYVVLPPLSESADLLEALREGHQGRLEPLLAFAEKCSHPV